MPGISIGELHKILNTLKAKHPSLGHKFFSEAETVARVFFKERLPGERHNNEMSGEEAIAFADELEALLPKDMRRAIPDLRAELDKAKEGVYGGSLFLP